MNECKDCLWSNLLREDWGADYECSLKKCCKQKESEKEDVLDDM